jgi:ribosomal protein S18 acetylase RimI-like enzyme
MPSVSHTAADTEVDVTIDQATARDTPALAALHAGALPDDFLPSLGARFLERVYYPATFESPHGVHLVARADQGAIGFVTIAHKTSAFTSDVLRGRLLQLARCAIVAASRRPAHLLKSAEVLWSVITARPDPIEGEIVLIAVSADARGRGVGKALVDAALGYLRRHGVSQCRTKTLEANGAVIGMYERLGWHVRDRFRLIGREYVTIVSPLL